MLDKPEYAVDSVVLYTSIAHVGWLLFEVVFFRGYMNKGINLEQRIKHPTDVRVKDLLRLGVIACVIGGIFMMPAFMAFDSQECKTHYYEVGDYECHDCTDFHGQECLTCVDNLICQECVKGHYLQNNKCHTCASYWPGCIDCQYSQETEDEKNGPLDDVAINTLDLTLEELNNLD